ncbi:MAG: hypothetical protein IJX61_01830 [Ruminococcus sp.]|nr:hypothetical protein [Ruminococcus sp.]
MKKLVTFVLTAMCMTFMSAMTSNAADNPTIGDINGDGAVNSSDASLILGYYADISVGTGAVTDEAFTAAADVNGDGIVDSSDASYVLEYYGYISTISENGELVSIRDFLKIPEKNPDILPVTTTAKPSGAVSSTKATSTKATAAASSTKATSTKATAAVSSTKVTIATTEEASTVTSYENDGAVQTTTVLTETPAETTTEIVNYVLAPEGLDPGEKGSIQYIINTAKLTPHDEIPLYNIKGDNMYGGNAYLANTYMLTDKTKEVLNNFAKEHFTDEMTNYDRLEYTWNWLHFNVDYASSWEAYSKISGLSFSEACFVYKSGQCIQYNGAFAEMMAYMGYDVYLLEKWQHGLSVQHFMSEVMIDGVGYNTEVGERSYDSPPNYYWKWLFDSSKQEFYGIGQKKPEPAAYTGDKKWLE